MTGHMVKDVRTVGTSTVLYTGDKVVLIPAVGGYFARPARSFSSLCTLVKEGDVRIP